MCLVNITFVCTANHCLKKAGLCRKTERIILLVCKFFVTHLERSKLENDVVFTLNGCWVM